MRNGFLSLNVLCLFAVLAAAMLWIAPDASADCGCDSGAVVSSCSGCAMDCCEPVCDPCCKPKRQGLFAKWKAKRACRKAQKSCCEVASCGCDVVGCSDGCASGGEMPAVIHESHEAPMTPDAPTPAPMPADGEAASEAAWQRILDPYRGAAVEPSLRQRNAGRIPLQPAR